MMTALPRVPDVLLERYRLGELPQDEADRIAQLAREDPALGERLDALDRSDEALRASGAIDAIASRVRNHVDAHSHAPAAGRGVASYWIVPAIAAATIAIVVFARTPPRSEEHTSELQSHSDLVCRLLLEKKKRDTAQGPTS